MSEKLLSDTLTGNEIEVANAIQNVRETNYAPMFYNDEQALRYAVKFAYIICEDRYTRIEELPSGRGLADIVYLPDQGERLPALIIELKWNKTDESALAQIKNHKYPAALNKYTGNIILVGINYDEKTKKHSCKIETIVNYIGFVFIYEMPRAKKCLSSFEERRFFAMQLLSKHQLFFNDFYCDSTQFSTVGQFMCGKKVYFLIL